MQHSLILCLNFARELSLLGGANEQVSFFRRSGAKKGEFQLLTLHPTPTVPISLCISIPSIAIIYYLTFVCLRSSNRINRWTT